MLVTVLAANDFDWFHRGPSAGGQTSRMWTGFTSSPITSHHITPHTAPSPLPPPPSPCRYGSARSCSCSPTPAPGLRLVA